MRDKQLSEATCRHCGQPIFYSDFTECWLHLESCDKHCRRCEAEPE